MIRGSQLSHVKPMSRDVCYQVLGEVKEEKEERRDDGREKENEIVSVKAE